MKQPLIDRLKVSEPIVCDGSFPTSLYDKGFYINRSFDELSVTEAQAVREVTQGFKRAGALLLHTNTFGSLRSKLQKHGLQEQAKEIIESAVNINLEVAGDDAYVLGAVGPLGLVMEPLGPTSVNEAESYFTDIVQVLAEKADGISFLGFHDLNELAVGVRVARALTDKPIFAHLGIQENMKTSYGHTLDEHVSLMEELGADVIGFSGEVGPSGMLTAIERVRGKTNKPISLLPNAGLPRYVNDQYIYLCNPDYLGKYAKRFVQAGANIVGGFSGVKEEHTRAITNALRMTQSLSIEPSQNYTVPESIREVVDEPQEPVSLSQRSKLGKALESGERIFSVEIIPPKGVDCSKFFDHCKELEEGGVQFVNIPDGARAVARMGSLQLAAYVSQKFNLEPIPHFTTRDRNLLGLQGDLLGSYVNGVRNVLLVTGDPPKLGNLPGATAVYDVDAIGLTHVVNRMNHGLDLGGSSFGRPTEFVVGVALNPTASNRELEIRRFKYKIEAGAEYAITQPIYDVEKYKEFFEELGEVEIPIVMGIWPLVSLRNAEFLKNEVPGVEVPDFVIERMKNAGTSAEDSVKMGVEIALETMQNAKDLVAGFQVSAPFNRVSVALEAIHSL